MADIRTEVSGVHTNPGIEPLRGGPVEATPVDVTGLATKSSIEQQFSAKQSAQNSDLQGATVVQSLKGLDVIEQGTKTAVLHQIDANDGTAWVAKKVAEQSGRVGEGVEKVAVRTAEVGQEQVVTARGLQEDADELTTWRGKRVAEDSVVLAGEEAKNAALAGEHVDAVLDSARDAEWANEDFVAFGEEKKNFNEMLDRKVVAKARQKADGKRADAVEFQKSKAAQNRYHQMMRDKQNQDSEEVTGAALHAAHPVRGDAAKSGKADAAAAVAVGGTTAGSGAGGGGGGGGGGAGGKVG